MVNMCIKSQLIINNNAQILATFNPLNLNIISNNVTVVYFTEIIEVICKVVFMFFYLNKVIFAVLDVPSLPLQ